MYGTTKGSLLRRVAGMEWGQPQPKREVVHAAGGRVEWAGYSRILSLEDETQMLDLKL